VQAAQRSPGRRSLKARALQLLAQREHSRLEIRRKLLVHARADAIASAAEHNAAPSEPSEPSEPAEQVEAVLDWLESHQYLSQERFVESRVHARAGRFGNVRIRQELAQHAVALSPQAAQALKDSEFERAQAVWARKYGAAPDGLAEHARQARFLASRGFSAEVIRRLLRGTGRAAASRGDIELADD
jgi:regulatory protein